ncbi:wd-40 repeat-containing protein [Stylonychia lemnae]|uniref:Wd-40 repeat-containing protein n=1 Tax=Stylonychia lemnae TaxID=5949 RepID=A0A078B735_STYLE|nr:wd-40 repeat-containing protein [Stylonychia lemnae]|eukprot:CDW90006.1 wd-40 repeat-containing protein [Stylonychia lemnae]
MLAIVQFNKILLMAAAEFRVIDILDGHSKKIKCLDVSQISKIIVSFSQDLIIVYSQMRDESILQDHVITNGPLKWKESWRYELKMPIRNLNMSPIGDFFAISGDGLLSVWTRDGPNIYSYSNAIYYSREENAKILASIIKQKDLGTIVQQEVTKDGRLLICLESRGKTVKIFYQDKIRQIKQQEKKKEESEPLDYRNLNKNQDSRWKKKEEKDDLILAYNPYADLDNMGSYDNDGQGNQRGDHKIDAQDLFEYLLPQHRFQIEYFKILHHDIYESEKRNLPNIILTVTSKNEIYFWQENLMSGDMMFNCIHIIKGSPNTPFFDVSFLEFPPINPKRYVELKSNISKLLDTSRDEILRIKKEENQFGIYQENYHENTLDWVLILNDHQLDIYKVESLRNFPHRSVCFTVQSKFQMSYNPLLAETLMTFSVYTASIVSGRSSNSEKILQYSFDNQRHLQKEQSQTKWKIDKLLIMRRKTIENVITHQQLPFVAHIMKNTEIYFYIDEQSKNQIIKRPDMKFLGAYSVYHTTKNESRVESTTKIISAKWVKNLCQMVIHFSNNSLALLSSFTQLRIIAHQKHPEEYLKLWEEKRSQIAEKWEKIFEIKFDDGADKEQIVDFEIIDSKLTESGFKVQIAIFTNKNQYLIYETDTELFENMRTKTETNLLYNKYTTDNLLKLLGSCSDFENENKTVIAMITEQDPSNQPEQLKSPQPAAQSSYSNPFGDEDDDDGSDSSDGDIFGQISGIGKKKDKYVPLKKKQQEVIVEVKKDEPLKHTLLLKLAIFNEKSLAKKQYEELWKVEFPLSYKSKNYKCKNNSEFFSFMINDGPNDDLYIYLYDLTSNKYIGFVNTTEILGIKQDINQVDYVLTRGSAKGSITLYSQDNLYLIAQSSRDGQPGIYENVVQIDKSQIKKVQLYESPWRRLIIVINNHHLDIKDKFIEYKDDMGKTDLVNILKSSLHQIYTNQQKALFIKGYGSIVLKILVKLQNTLENTPGVVSEFLDYDLEQIIHEIMEIQQQNSSQGQAKKKVETASSMFDDFYGFGDEKPKEEKKDTKESTNQQKEFEDGFNQFIINIRTQGKEKLGLSDDQKRDYMLFSKRFKQLYKKDFFSDNLTTILLRKIFYETEEIELEEIDKKKEEKMSAQPFNVMDFIQQIRGQVTYSKANIALIKQWTSFETALALHSESQDVIFQELQTRFDFDNNLNWEMMKKLCIPVWLKDISKIKILVEKIAKVEYKNGADDLNKASRAERTALWYILIGKKNFLCSLYKQEAQQKRIYDFLMQDFTQPKVRTQASKNALALMSKKNYITSCAFFLLSGSIKDALQVALDRLNDPVLAVLIVRLMDQEDSEILKDVYLKHFVERGEKAGDPYLQNIGRWQRKEFLKSVNIFTLDNTKSNNIQSILKFEHSEFNLYFSQFKHDQQIKQDELNDFVPHLSRYDYFALDFVKALKKNTNVKRQIQKTWNNGGGFGGGGGGGSIFDDFYGDSSAQTQKKQEEVKQEESKLNVDESKIMEMVTFETSQRGYSLVSLLVMTENQDFVEQMDRKYKQLLSNSLLTDVIQSMIHGDYNGQISKLNKSINLLAERLDIEPKESKEFIRKQLKHIENLNLIIGYLIEDGKESVMYKVEQEALKQMNFINSMADFPFITDGGFKDKRGFNMIKMVDFLENLVESYMQVDFQEQRVSIERKETIKAKQQKAKAGFIDFDDDEGMLDTEEKKGDIDVKKVRATMIIYISLIQLSFIAKKFGMVKQLVVDLRNILGTRLLEGNISADDINLQNLKTKIQKFKYTLMKPIETDQEKEDLQYQQVGVGLNKLTKEQEDLIKMRNKINQFMILWIRFIISHNTYQLVDFQFEKTQIRNLIDLRPSIINTRPLNEAIEIIMNPRLISGELLKKFGNMHRILENVTTYYFENFLNIQERAIILEELKRLQIAKYDQIQTDNIDFSQIFTNENKFTEFAHFFDLTGFIKHLKDHELSLIYNTNNDYSHYAVQKTQELFESGIDIFRLKSESVNGFAFDRCDMDLVSLAMLGKGIREIPVHKALLYRNRLSKGHQVLDEEYTTWHECLKRFDKVSQEHSNLKATNEPIIAIVDKLYSYKTVNYTKKPRRKRGTLFLDYEMSPPDLWSSHKSTDYLKTRSSQEINHDEYAACVESHPFLPLYMTSNQRGVLCLWGFNQNEDRSLDQWHTAHEDIKPKKATVKKIQFNGYGDKIISLNMEGSMFIHRFDNNDMSRTVPIYQLRKTKERKFNDLSILNQDTVIAMASLKPKHVWVHDTLIGQRAGLVMESQIGGNIIQPIKKRSHLLLLNEKPGQMNILDLKMNKVVQSINLHNDEATSIAVYEGEGAIADGMVKIYNADKDYELRESFVAFSSQGNKKGVVTAVKVHPGNGALFASSASGNFKILRTK